MDKNSTIETKKNKPAFTLRQLDNHIIVTSDGEPATLYQIAYHVFLDRSSIAIDAAEKGDFSQIEKLLSEITMLVDNFVQHGLFLHEEKAILKDPDGPEARRLKELNEYAERVTNEQRAEIRKEKRLSRVEK